jgi:hypothetical protein
MLRESTENEGGTGRDEGPKKERNSTRNEMRIQGNQSMESKKREGEKLFKGNFRENLLKQLEKYISSRFETKVPPSWTEEGRTYFQEISLSQSHSISSNTQSYIYSMPF